MTFCILAEHCSVFDPTQLLPGLSYAARLCEGCRARAESELNLLRYDYVDLSQLVPAAQRHSEVRIARPKPSSRPPLNLGVFTLRGRIAWVVLLAEQALRAHRGDRPGRNELPVREGFALDTAVRYLQPRVDELAALPGTEAFWDLAGEQSVVLDGAAVLRLVGLLHRSARKACGLDTQQISLPGDCPKCAASSLRRSPDDPGRIWCVHCRVTLTGAEYLQHVRLIAPVTEAKPQR